MLARIIVADDQTITRQGLRALFESEGGYEVVGEAQNGQEAIELAQELRPDVIVMDLAMPELNGIDATRTLIEAGNAAKIVILTVSPSSQKLSDALSAGASAYVVKHGPFDELLEAMRMAMEGRLFVSPSIAQELIASCVRGRRPSPQSAEALSARERQVLQLLTEGWTARAIGQHLGVSVKTIESYRRQIMEKLGIDSIALLTKYAVREGLTTLEV